MYQVLQDHASHQQIDIDIQTHMRKKKHQQQQQQQWKKSYDILYSPWTCIFVGKINLMVRKWADEARLTVLVAQFKGYLLKYEYN